MSVSERAGRRDPFGAAVGSGRRTGDRAGRGTMSTSTRAGVGQRCGRRRWRCAACAWSRYADASTAVRGVPGGNAGHTSAMPSAEKTAEQTALIDHLNEDLRLEFQSIVQYVQHVAMITGRRVHEHRRRAEDPPRPGAGPRQRPRRAGRVPRRHARTTVGAGAARRPTRTAPCRPTSTSRRDQLERYRTRVQEATDAGLPDVAEALRPLLTETQEHVRDLQAALGE